MPIVNGQFVVPGVFSSVNQNVLPTAPGGVRIPALICTGRTTNLVQNEQVTRGVVAPPSTDALAHTATAIDGNIQDENFVMYTNGVDFALTGGGVGWLSNAAQLTSVNPTPYAGLVGKTFIIAVASGSLQSYTFVGGDFSDPANASASEVATALSGFTGVTVTAPGDAKGTGTITVTDYSNIAGSATVTVNGVILTNGAEWTAATSNNDTAASIALAITNATATTKCTAAAVATNIVTITANTAGTAGNVSLASSDAVRLLVSHATLQGGTNGHVKVATIATSNSSLYIGTGTSNSILGFTAGSYVQTPDAPAAGVEYFVTYEYAKVTADYTPKFYFTLQAVTNDYGPVSTTTSISNGASLAFQNGASIVCVCQENPADGSPVSQVQSALNKLLATPNIWIVVSLEGGSNPQLLSAIKQHVDTASSTINKLERRAIVGFDETVTTFTDTNMLNYAASTDDERVVLLNSSTVVNMEFVGTATTATQVGSQYVAAALAGVRCNPAFDVAQPMTREVISGFASISNTLTQAEKSLLINQGVCVIDVVSGVPKVLFGTTTDFATVAAQLEQVTEIADFCVQSLRGLLDPIFIGQKLLANTPSQVQTVVSAILQSIQQSNIIVAFTTPVVTVDISDPTRIDISVGIQPTLEIDVIFITLGLNLQ
jgi:hypothetical protein